MTITTLFRYTNRVRLAVEGTTHATRSPTVRHTPTKTNMSGTTLPYLRHHYHRRQLRRQARNVTLRHPFRRETIQNIRTNQGIFQVVTKTTSTNPRLNINNIRRRSTTTLRHLINRDFNNLLSLPKGNRPRPRYPTINKNRSKLNPRLSLNISNTRRNVPHPTTNRRFIGNNFRPNDAVTLTVGVPRRLRYRQDNETSPYH